jgi:hypothetical protein
MALTKASMATFVKAQMATVPAPDGTAAGAQAYRDALIEALCGGIVQEIQANSMLIPITTDSGPAGAGIITGKVG